MVTINEPHVTVTDVEKIKTKSYGDAGKIALIGAFPNSTFQIDSFTTLEAAQAKVGAESIPEGCISYGCLEYIFNQDNQSKGAEEVIIYNTNYGKSVLTYTITNGDIANALTVLADEDFDILTIADTINLEVEGDSSSVVLNPIWTTLKTFVDSQYMNQQPFGIITSIGINNSSSTGETNLNAFKKLFEKRGFYKAVTTPVQRKEDADALTLAESGCWHAAFTAGRPVNKSETGKIYTDLVGTDTKSLFPITTEEGKIDWENLVDNGLHTTKYHNRKLQVIKCINNMTPTGRDMKIERVKNYMIKRLMFTDVFGEDNTKPSIDFVKGLFEYEKGLALKNKYLTNMSYEITHCSNDCIRAQLALEIPDVVRNVRLEVSVEITPYEEA